MPGPFDRFTDRAKRVLALSQDEAIRFNHNYIGTEHLLLGLVREGEGVAARVLDQMGIQLSAIRRSVEASTGRGTSVAPSEIFLSPGVKRVIELAGEEAKNLGHSHVGTENLLLGMIRHEDEKSPARLVLANLGVDLEATRQRVIDTLAHPETIRRVAAVEASMLDAQGKKRDWYCEDVLSGKLKVKVLYEDENVLGMEHPHPTYQIHGVVIPKKHVSSLLAPEALDPVLLASMLRGVQAVAKALGLDQQGFRMEANAAGPGVTPHMHWHVAGPGLPPPMRWKARAIGPVAATPRSAGFTFDRFDDGAKRVLALAQEEAIRLNHNYIGTEHLLAGLVRESSSAAARALLSLGVPLDKVRTALEFIVGRGDTQQAPSDITLSPRTRKVIELAIDEADRMKQQTVSAGHLLIGLVREGEGIASGIIQSLKVDLEAVRQKVIEEMRKGS